MRAVFALIVVVLFSTPCCAQQTVTEKASQGSAKKTTQGSGKKVAAEVQPKSRTFRFTYGATLTELKPGAGVRVWIPVATNTFDQEASIVTVELPDGYQETNDSSRGNNLIYFEAKANETGEVPMKVLYRVTRREITPARYEPISEGGDWKKASKLVPTSEQLRKVILDDGLAKGSSMQIAKRLYAGVDKHMSYDKPADKPGWGQGDAVWACDARFGNCTDFHSLFISAARSLDIPARFEIGFPIPETRGSGEVGGYHCWAKFQSEGSWVPVDISEADKDPTMAEYYFGNLTENRVTFSMGRDLVLQPATAAETVNYLAYPYAEVDGKPHKSFRKEFRYEDVK